MNRLLEDLNKDQLEAVTTTSGPLLVIAGAGSGKTRVLTRRLAYILTERLAEPYQTLAVTFTNKAAGEMKGRVAKLLGGDIPGLNVSTFHSFCARLLRREAEQLGYAGSFTILDEDDSETLTKNCIKDLSLLNSQFTPRAQGRKISDAKNRLIGAESFLAAAAGYFETTTAQIYLLYQQRLRECNAMDFDDLLFNAVLLLRDNPQVGERYRQRFKYLMVDEYQDTNHAQYVLLKYLLGEHQNIAVVGDEDQSIYGWRGADIRNILEFEKDFPGARTIKLEQNYRSTNLILQAASSVIRNNQARKGKTLWTEYEGGDQLKLLLVDSAEAEASYVVDHVERAKSDTPLKGIAVLYRTNAQSRAFEEQLRRRNLPYQIIGGIGFYQRKEIKDVMAYLKLIVNPKDDVSFERVINYPRRGVGDKTVADIAAIAHRERLPFYEVVKSRGVYPELSTRTARMEPFVELVEKYRALKDSRPVDLLAQDLVADLGLIAELRREDPIIGQTKVENIESFIEGATAFVRANSGVLLENYLDTISLFTDLDTYSQIEDKVTLMTIHTAKGLEYDTVFLVGLEEGLFPLGKTLDQPMELEEERRLFYVGATRAKRRVILSSASARYRFGEVMSVPSRFIKEIPAELVEKIDYRTGRYSDAGGVRTPASFFPSAAVLHRETTGVHYEYEADEVMRVGRIVQHPTFGRGKIVQTEGFGESLRLDIMFSGVGLKKVMARYARLKVVG